MTTQTKRLEFEQKLIQLKQDRDSNAITLDEYIDQAGKLRFDDETAGRTWWLDPESETWWVAPLGTEDFEEYIPPAEPQTPPPQPETTSPEPEPPPVPPKPEDEPELRLEEPEKGFASSPETQTESQPQPFEPIPESQPEPEPILSSIHPKVILFVVAAITILILSGLGGVWLFSNEKQTPTATTIAVQSTPTTNPVSFTETPTSTPSPTSIPTTTFTPISPSATSIPSPTSSATVTSSAFPSATDTPMPIPTDTPSSLPVTDTPAPTFTPTLSPDETEEPGFSGKLAYPEFDDKTKTYKIVVVDLSTEEIIIKIPQASQPALNLDGSKLAYISWAPEKVGLYSISLLSDGTKNTLSNKTETQRPQWSFNGKDKVFEYKKGNQEDIRFSDETGLAGIQMGRTPTWSPDGRVVLHAGKDGQYGLAVINTDGTNLEFLTNNTNDVAPAVSHDGKWIAYTSADDVWLISINGGEPNQLAASSSREGIPTWSPDGQWIAFAAEVGGQWSVQVIHPDGTGQQKLLDIPGGLDGIVASEAYRYQGWLHESISWSR